MILQAEGLPPIHYELRHWVGHYGQWHFYASCELNGTLYDYNFLSEPYQSKQDFLDKAMPWMETAFRNTLKRITA